MDILARRDRKQQQYPIDFVVTWLDSSDPEWQAQFAKYKQEETGRMESARFRNLDIFQYWFRAVEQYAPWVNKVFLVTNGTFPKWIISICLNDTAKCPDDEFEIINSRLQVLLEKKFPVKSKYEI